MSVVVGLDCGGSTTRLLAVDADGTVVASAQAGPANLMTTPSARLRANLARVAAQCPPAQAVCGCFAGLLGETQREFALGLLGELFPGARKGAEPDYAAALAAAPKGTDLLVIAGTGSLVCSRAGDVLSKSGGRGYLVGDEGSAAKVGLAGLRRYLDAPERAPDAVREAVVKHFGASDEATVLAALYGDSNPAPRLAKLARAVARAAAVASEWRGLVREEAERLAAVVAGHRQRLHGSLGSPTLALAGGLWKVSALYATELAAALEVCDPQANYRLAKAERPPVEGAVALAREMTYGN